MPDLYDILDVSRDASQEEIKRAYRERARESHPDAGGDAEAFKAVQHAYQILSDPQRRRRYDRFGDDGTPGSRGAGDPFGFGGGGFGDIGEVIDAFFGSAFGQASTGRSSRGGTRRQRGGRDVLVPLELDLEDVVSDGRHSVEVEVAVTCEECGGGGSASGAGPDRCSTCGGAGQVQRVVRTAFGQLATASACPACDGAGQEVSDPCTACGGEGRRVRSRSITVEVPRGVEAGDRVRVAGAGEAGRHGAPDGDLYVEIRIRPHDLYERDGRELHGEVVVPVVQAALGATVTVPGIDGGDVEADVPAGIQPGEVVRIRGAGLPGKGGGRRGDVHLHVGVEVPRDLDGEQRDLLHRLAELRGEAISERGGGLLARLRDALR